MDRQDAEKLIDAMRELDEMRVLNLAMDLSEQGVSAYDIHETLLEGVRAVGRKYEAGEYYIADVIMAGHIIRSAMKSILIFREDSPGSVRGRVLICTVQGDIHDLGKAAVGEVLRGNGFQVTDLGVDTPPDTVAEAVRKHAPDVLILSGTLSSSSRSMRNVIRTLEQSGLRKTLKVMVGGPAVNGLSPRLLGADAKCETVRDALRLCREFTAPEAEA